MRYRVQHTKIQPCAKCGDDYVTVNRNTKYCQTCFDLYFSPQAVYEKRMEKQIDFILEVNNRFDETTPKYIYGTDKSILREIENTGAVQPSFDPMPDPNGVKNTHPQLSNRFKYVPPKQENKPIEDEYDDEYYKLLKRIQEL